MPDSNLMLNGLALDVLRELAIVYAVIAGLLLACVFMAALLVSLSRQPINVEGH